MHHKIPLQNSQLTSWEILQCWVSKWTKNELFHVSVDLKLNRMH